LLDQVNFAIEVKNFRSKGAPFELSGRQMREQRSQSCSGFLGSRNEAQDCTLDLNRHARVACHGPPVLSLRSSLSHEKPAGVIDNAHARPHGLQYGLNRRPRG
jgi:hypothetical protein